MAYILATYPEKRLLEALQEHTQTGCSEIITYFAKFLETGMKMPAEQTYKKALSLFLAELAERNQVYNN